MKAVEFVPRGTEGKVLELVYDRDSAGTGKRYSDIKTADGGVFVA